jgi:hypothetical protein
LIYPSLTLIVKQIYYSFQELINNFWYQGAKIPVKYSNLQQHDYRVTLIPFVVTIYLAIIHYLVICREQMLFEYCRDFSFFQYWWNFLFSPEIENFRSTTPGGETQPGDCGGRRRHRGLEGVYPGLGTFRPFARGQPLQLFSHVNKFGQGVAVLPLR